ncbi:hypothetical protein NDN08_002789 [Rhodosorus marinus]|uniref:Uncharacterized protein n=1 Tax=Rhodosorus marinus TaxID=101924 RepID=A0AAV8V0H5_9RHOD|nr:hypothetical protein NDN08_002789 [Rhodosorus marinus]
MTLKRDQETHQLKEKGERKALSNSCQDLPNIKSSVLRSDKENSQLKRRRNGSKIEHASACLDQGALRSFSLVAFPSIRGSCINSRPVHNMAC